MPVVIFLLIIIAFVVLILVPFLKKSRASNENSDKFSKDIKCDEVTNNKEIPDILSEVFGNVEYNWNDCIDTGLIRKTRIKMKKKPFKRAQYIYGKDFVKGEYKGIQFEMSDIELTSKPTKETRGNGDSSTSINKLFKGLFMVLDLKRKLASDVILSEGRIIDNIGGKSLKTHDDDFDRIYSIEADTEDNLKQVITPEIIEAIKVVNEKTGIMYYQFQKDGKVIVVNDIGEYFFGESLKKNDDKLNDNIKEKLSTLADLFDKLRVSE